jgi:coproporphyrinogen III oxidase-like Fe-S oxidoreductase
MGSFNGQVLRPGFNPSVEVERLLDADDLVFEFFLNALRLRRGVENKIFTERTGLSISRLQKALRKAGQKGLLASDPTRLAPSDLGFRFLNDLQLMFLADGHDVSDQGNRKMPENGAPI